MWGKSSEPDDLTFDWCNLDDHRDPVKGIMIQKNSIEPDMREKTIELNLINFKGEVQMEVEFS